MSDLINSAAGEHGNDSRIYGVAVAEVLSNWDSLGQGRVQLRLPWMPDFQPWARGVSTFCRSPSAGRISFPRSVKRC